jgi:hypothetical protein
MPRKIGRPKSENPKTNPIHVRLDNDTLQVLDKYCERHKKTRTGAIRDGIMMLDGR